MRIFRWLMALLPLAAFVAPAQSATISNEDVHLQYDYSEFYAVTNNREFEVVVRGNPTSLPQPQFKARLMQLLGQAMRNTRTIPTTNPAVRTQHSNYRLVLVF